MRTRASKKKEDEIQAARRVVDTVIERSERVDPAVSAAAAALSKLGASKGGNARREALTPKRRSEIAKRAAAARWQK